MLQPFERARRALRRWVRICLWQPGSASLWGVWLMPTAAAADPQWVPSSVPTPDLVLIKCGTGWSVKLKASYSPGLGIPSVDPFYLLPSPSDEGAGQVTKVVVNIAKRAVSS